MAGPRNAVPAKRVYDLDGGIGDGERKTVFISGDVGARAFHHAVGNSHQAHWIEPMLAGHFRKGEAQKGPYKKPRDVAEDAAQKRKCLEQKRERSNEGHGG